MKLANVAVQTWGAKIKTYSSCLDSLQQPANILHSSQNTLWATGEGIPQFVIVTLEDLTVTFKSICEVGFMLWHDYDTNPKEIELWVAETTEQEFVFWARFELEQKKGIQLYEIKPLPQKYIYLKISITETYGAFQTYLNQVFFMANGVVQNRQEVRAKAQKQVSAKEKKKELDLEDLQSNLNQLVQIDRKITRSKSQKKQRQQKKLNRMSRQNELEKHIIDKNMQYQTKQEKHVSRQQYSKGSMSSNKPGRSIYYRSDDYQEDESHQYVSNQYESSSSNANPNLEFKKRKDKISSQQSQDFSHSLQSHNTHLSPSLNVDSQLNSFSGKQHFFTKKVIQKIQMQENNKMPYKRLVDEERKEHSNKKTKQYSYDQEEPEEQHFERQNDKYHIQEEQEVHEINLRKQNGSLSDDEELSNDFVKNTPKYKELSQNYHEDSQSDHDRHEFQESSSQEANNYNEAILALSKHVVKLEDNMESIQRKVQVLDLRVAHSHQKIQDQILQKVQNKVQEIVDRRLHKIWSLKNAPLIKLQHSTEGKPKIRQRKQEEQQQEKNYDRQKQVYKKNLTKQFFKSDYYAQQENMAQMKDRTKTKRRNKKKYPEYEQRKQVDDYSKQRAERRLKASKSFTNITNKYNNITKPNQITLSKQNNAGKNSNQAPNQQYIASLLQRLNSKLKQRELKLNKMQRNRSRQKQQGQNASKKTKHYEYRERADFERRAITNNNDYYY